MTVSRPTTTAHLPSGVVEHRWEPRGPQTVLLLRGGHMRAGLALGEGVFTDAGCSVLVPSRPGYGRTPLSTGPDPRRFAGAVHELCDRLGVARLAAVIGISPGGRTAVAFAPHVERLTWSGIRALRRVDEDLALRLLLADLSRLPAREVVANLDPAERADLVELFAAMRSGHGFRNDMRTPAHPTAAVRLPTLEIATRNDVAVPFSHAESLHAAIPGSVLVESAADSHFIWFGHARPTTDAAVRRFLSTPVLSAPAGPLAPED